MTSDNRSADEIERDIARERTQLSGTINDLQKKFSVEAIVNDIGSMFKGDGGEFGRSISQTIGRNPAAVALVGVGLAWLLIGPSRSTPEDNYRDNANRTRRNGGSWDRPSHQSARRTSNVSHDGDLYWFNDDMEPDDWEETRFGNRSSHDSDKHSGGIAGTLHDGADAVKGAVSHAAGAIRDAAVDMTERLAIGTEDFSEEARARVVAMRRAAVDARNASQEAMRHGGQVASNFFDEQPLVVGALAVALGAAVGGALPHSRMEDDTLGANRDRLFADAQRVFQEERNKAMAVLKAAAAEAKDTVKEGGAELAGQLPDGKTAGNVIVDHVTEAAQRVADRARDEAANQGLGERKS